MTRLGTAVLSILGLAAASAAGCGGSSTSFDAPRAGSAGRAGAVSGGSAGSTTSGGSGGSAGSGTGGSAGKGSGGSGGSPATGGGSGGDVGGNAGEAGGGTSGGGGTGAMTGYHPPSDQVDACTRTCQAAADADCPNADALAKCVLDCRTAIRVQACSDAWDTLFACEDADMAECDGNGKPIFPDCVDEYALAVACVYDTAVGGDLQEPCSNFCDAQASVTCDNSTNATDCTNSCQIVGTIVEVCGDLYQTYLECAATSDFSCDANGDPQADGCVADHLRFLACVVSEYDIEL